MGVRWHISEKFLIFSVLFVFGFICITTFLYLPDELDPFYSVESRVNKVYKVYKNIHREVVQAGEGLVLQAPPLDVPDSILRHDGKVADYDPHLLSDRAKLLSQIEKDLQLNELSREQHQPHKNVLPKPNYTNPEDKHAPADDELPPASHIDTEESEVVITGGEDPDTADKREFVKKMMIHAWSGYEKYAWGANEVKPVSKQPHSSLFGHTMMGTSIVDGMDTLFIMGLTDEFSRGKKWIENNLDFSKMTDDVSVFETNIRYIGGLLTLYSFTGDDLFKEKAQHIADNLLPAFNTKTGIPMPLVNIQTGAPKKYRWTSSSILSEFGTLHMEFAYLSDITGDPKYVLAVQKIRRVLKSSERPTSLYPNFLNPNTGKWGPLHISLGAMGDSFYEYLFKEWIRSGKTDLDAKEMFNEAAKNIVHDLIKYSTEGLMYIGDIKNNRIEHKMGHLTCFAGGMFGLAAYEEAREDKVTAVKGEMQRAARWMKIAKEITNTCHESYDRSNTKLGPESFKFTDSIQARNTKPNELYYILRPETVESYFIMWRLTHNQKYRDWGWEAVQALEKHCKVEGGYSGLKSVNQVPPKLDDVQQSFFLAETLKYLYLLFSDDHLISFDKWVFNTEAHPLPIKGANTQFYRASENDIHGVQKSVIDVETAIDFQKGKPLIEVPINSVL